ncbi:hypothetical protein MARPO_0185s0026 [Marchantia polymorpha]|uniref:Uncharacterized protein n=1 Tax=Marchantia polymorpha TaxID=3197 RepID=A0A2R6W1M1_MARPO|nr:hypothetical protein MARPO_0185s0026 [Marchantia polymorpha]|eukprot:PTQ27751.1 hypothetical protein MARPO_0185s0026 [Marchantia polymorpha]
MPTLLFEEEEEPRFSRRPRPCSQVPRFSRRPRPCSQVPPNDILHSSIRSKRELTVTNLSDNLIGLRLMSSVTRIITRREYQAPERVEEQSCLFNALELAISTVFRF